MLVHGKTKRFLFPVRVLRNFCFDERSCLENKRYMVALPKRSISQLVAITTNHVTLLLCYITACLQPLYSITYVLNDIALAGRKLTTFSSEAVD